MKQEKLRLQRGNRKLPRETLIWNLPSGVTCPGATAECIKHCYAKKAEKMYPQVLPYRSENLGITKSGAFIVRIVNELSRFKNWNQVRIHESGDFYSQKYFDDWCWIANNTPNKIFYAYTKVKTLDLSKKPNNFILIFSDDNENVTITELRKLGFNGTARVTTTKLHTKFEKFCDMSCKECDYCFTNPKQFKRIVFPKH